MPYSGKLFSETVIRLQQTKEITATPAAVARHKKKRNKNTK